MFRYLIMTFILTSILSCNLYCRKGNNMGNNQDTQQLIKLVANSQEELPSRIIALDELSAIGDPTLIFELKKLRFFTNK